MTLEPTRASDCYSLAFDLRECDRQELALGRGGDPAGVLRDSMDTSAICQTIWTHAGTIAGIWGAALTPTPLVGSIWMLGSPELESIPVSFLRACHPSIERAHRLFPILACAPWRQNALHLRWLRWLGFTIQEAGHPHFLKATRHV